MSDRGVPAHVVNGDSVARTLRCSDVTGSVIVWRDVLVEGPLPQGDPAVVRRARAAFLSQSGFGAADAILADLAQADAALAAALVAGRETVLWFEHDLHDQLQLIQILARIDGHPARACLRLICANSFPGHPRFAGLGELSPAELASLWPQRRPLGDDTLACATRVYDVLRQGDARRLATLADGPLPGLPYLAAALRRLLEEHPWVGSELPRSERQVLQAVAGGASADPAVFAATWEMEEAPFMGDAWVFRRIDDLAERGLLERTDGQLALTPAGQAALSGAGA